MPNSRAVLTALMASSPPLAIATTSAFEACACSMNEEKSLVPSGWRTEPMTLPPFFSMKAVAPSCSARPNT